VSQGNQDSAGTGAKFKVHSAAAGTSRSRKTRRNGPVETAQLSQLAAELADMLSCGDRARWRIVSATVVIVENRPRGGRKP
jgi:hypothetical protein